VLGVVALEPLHNTYSMSRAQASRGVEVGPGWSTRQKKNGSTTTRKPRPGDYVPQSSHSSPSPDPYCTKGGTLCPCEAYGARCTDERSKHEKQQKQKRQPQQQEPACRSTNKSVMRPHSISRARGWFLNSFVTVYPVPHGLDPGPGSQRCGPQGNTNRGQGPDSPALRQVRLAGQRAWPWRQLSTSTQGQTRWRCRRSVKTLPSRKGRRCDFTEAEKWKKRTTVRTSTYYLPAPWRGQVCCDFDRPSDQFTRTRRGALAGATVIPRVCAVVCRR
jgi:hypothetical protein